ncbi:MAG: hypothetical protein ACKO96_44540 [Flammeovirgaceae bacterium]
MRHISIILLLLVVNVSFAQVSIVSAPALEIQATSQTGIMSTMNAVIGALESADRAYKEAMQKATWLRNLQTARRILYMVENLICTSKNLSIRMNSIGYTSCLMSYRFDMSIIKVQQSADYLGIILASGVAMTPAERMKSLDNVITSFEESQEMMVRLNKALDSDLVRLRLANNTAAAADLLMSYDRSGNKR